MDELPFFANNTIERAYWEFDARHKGYNRWAQTPQSERDAFKCVAAQLMADAFAEGKRVALAKVNAMIDTPPQCSTRQRMCCPPTQLANCNVSP